MLVTCRDYEVNDPNHKLEVISQNLREQPTLPAFFLVKRVGDQVVVGRVEDYEEFFKDVSVEEVSCPQSLRPLYTSFRPLLIRAFPVLLLFP